ncbi:cytochrome P450 [Amycolatopsis antarctica]|uniref:Cytochrome P450 n=1 Tax=Amycolatopsis antarctica TaxID=1854586 RepID=A0A263D5H0_9PSEU|nr:cytochrome P450 [Amycolatopsis antarctica]OZM73288.1 cytochrome P450 [Amycolatopsis antarctica]
MSSPSLTDVDLADPRTFADQDLAAFWHQLRQEQPLYWHPESDDRPGFWVLSRHEDLLAIYRDTSNFTSERGNILDTLLQGGDSAAGRMLAVTDGARHVALRRILLKSFSPRALQPILERLRSATSELVDNAVRQGAADFAKDVAAKIPLNTICDLLDVPESDRPEVLRLTKSALASDTLEPDRMSEWLAKNDILMYFAKIARRRKGTPHSDVVSHLAVSSIDGVELTEDEIVLNCYSLILGGDETSRLSMIGGLHAMIDNPAQWRALRDGEVSVDGAVEEVLRWTTPTMHFGRSAVRDVEMHGQRIRAGDIVTLWHSSADFDERVFDNPGEFDLARSPNNHVAFGYGPHFCIGAYLGRAEIRAMLATLIEKVSDIRSTGGEKRIYSNFLSGFSSLPVELFPSSGPG